MPRREQERARLTSPQCPAAPPSGELCLEFHYHMYGGNVGRLNVYVYTEHVPMHPTWTMSGNQSDVWNIARIPLTFDRPFHVEFEAVIGGGSKGDIAIDDVTLRGGSCDGEGLSHPQWIQVTNSWDITPDSNTFDGNFETFSNSPIPQDGGGAWYLTFDLQQRHAVTKVGIASYGDVTHDATRITIQFSNRRSGQWEDVGTWMAEQATVEMQIFQNFTAVGHYWRVKVLSTYGGGQPWIREVWLYGRPDTDDGMKDFAMYPGQRLSGDAPLILRSVSAEECAWKCREASFQCRSFNYVTSGASRECMLSTVNRATFGARLAEDADSDYFEFKRGSSEGWELSVTSVEEASLTVSWTGAEVPSYYRLSYRHDNNTVTDLCPVLSSDQSTARLDNLLSGKMYTVFLSAYLGSGNVVVLQQSTMIRGSGPCGVLSFRHVPASDCRGSDTARHEDVSLQFCAARCCEDPTCVSFQYNAWSTCILKNKLCSATQKISASYGNMYDRISDPPLDVEFTLVTENSLTLVWNAPRPTPLIYDVTYTKCGDVETKTLPGDSTSLTVDGLELSTEYGFTVVAIGERGISEPVQVTQATLPLVPPPGEFCSVNSSVRVDSIKLKYVGCWNTWAAAVEWRRLNMLTLEWCAEKCRTRGYRYAGLWYEYKCGCALALDASVLRLPDGHCRTICAGNRYQNCGGVGGEGVSVYDVGEVGQEQRIDAIPGAKCGPTNPLPGTSVQAKCYPFNMYPCCSSGGWCGITSVHCTCPDCVDYRLSVEKFCWKKHLNKANTLSSNPSYEDRPNLFYFGYFGDNEDACARACAQEPLCMTYTLVLTTYANAWLAGRCYGWAVSSLADASDVISGVKTACPTESKVSHVDCPCLKNITQPTGTITSPGPPSGSGEQRSCAWLVHAEEGFIIELTFEPPFQVGSTGPLTTTSTGADRVEVYDGASDTAPSLGKFSGGQPPPRMYSTGSDVYIRFVSLGSTTGLAGFTAKFRWVGLPARKGGLMAGPYQGVGLSNRWIPDSDVTASSQLPGYEAAQARLHNMLSPTASGGWRTTEDNEWVTVTFPTKRVILGISTQGIRGPTNCWVTSYHVRYAYQGAIHTVYRTFLRRENDPDFRGNFDADTVVTNMFNRPIVTDKVYIYPQTVVNHTCLRFELLEPAPGTVQFLSYV
ncbi:uncharacterized protein LOC144908144 [Branchiostoma floridae x Branchiostoma belcheri]